MLVNRNSPAGPLVLRPWMTCPAPRTTGPAGLAAATGPRCIGPCGTARPGQPHACLTRPKSFRDHFAAEALLALVESLATSYRTRDARQR